jgi:RNA polymerase sigma-70 factor (ECF subfamily)
MQGSSDFAQIAEQHLRDVYGYLAYLTGDRELAEELTSVAFEKALRSWSRYDPRRASANTWLCTIARSVALDHFRSEDRRRRREDAYAVRQEFEVREPSFADGLSPELERALGELSPADREVIALRVVLEFDPDETARLLGISKTACTTRLSRALAKLQEKVADDVLA